MNPEPPDDDVELTDDELAIEEALADMRTGKRGIPLDVFDRRFRERHGLLPPDGPNGPRDPSAHILKTKGRRNV